jgi:hypothetical protein
MPLPLAGNVLQTNPGCGEKFRVGLTARQSPLTHRQVAITNPAQRFRAAAPVLSFTVRLNCSGFVGLSIGIDDSLDKRCARRHQRCLRISFPEVMEAHSVKRQ